MTQQVIICSHFCEEGQDRYVYLLKDSSHNFCLRTRFVQTLLVAQL